MTNGTRPRANTTSKTDLDFSGLFGQKKERSKTLVEPSLEGNAYQPANQAETLSTGQIEALEGVRVSKLINGVKEEREARAEAIKICREHQVNTAKSQQIQSEILKGMKAGADIYGLFLKATEAISIMTNNKLFYTQAEADLTAIYGIGLQERPPLSMELERVRERLQRLTNAEGRETDPDNRERIRRAIIAHKARVADLEEVIRKTQ